MSTASVVPIVTLEYEDLVSFDPLTSSIGEAAQLVEQIGQAFGPTGLGILAVRGVPDFGSKRQALLPLAAQLPTLVAADLPVDAASLYSVGWSHGKEEIQPGQPDTAKGSFYANPLTEDLAQALRERDGDEVFFATVQEQTRQHPEFYAPNVWPSQSLPQLSTAFTDMGRLLQNVGICVARVCDVYCQQHGVTTHLESILRDSLNAKGRLLHYFAPEENHDANATNTSNKESDTTSPDSDMPWCAWHNDHGALTGLVPGMYLSSGGEQEVACPDPERCGLFVQPRSSTAGPPVRVVVPSDHCAFQVGETSQILSGGLLQATPHAVLHSRSEVMAGVTRESFAVFLEPEFGAPLDVPVGKTIEDCQGGGGGGSVHSALRLPPLSARWKVGQTFGDFHLATVSTFAVTD